jgi:N-acyl-D-aspartate/D-glutamate deacylase
MLDLKIVGGLIVDGSGAAPRHGDLGIRDGRIVAIGVVNEAAAQTIDAAGRVVAPGFIDVHTHYDAQAFWDPTLSPSPFHGVTTVLGGFCGFSIAPLSPESAPYLMPMLARVEGMPLESLAAGVPWDWSSFAEYLGKLDGKLAVNAGFLCGHSAVRRLVMGARAVGERASEAEIAAMQALVRESIRGGALGFSSSWAITHNDADGYPVPSRHASREELLALYAVAAEFAGTIAEMAAPSLDFTEETWELLTDISLAARRTVNWNLLSVKDSGPEETARANRLLAASDHAAAQGARVIALTLPQTPRVRINLLNGVLFDAISGWAELFRLPVAERIAQLRDPAVVARLREGAEQTRGAMANLAKIANLRIVEVFSPENEACLDRIVGEIAREQGRDPFDVFFSIALADGLRTSFTPVYPPDTREAFAARARLWADPRTVVGGSDAGAHLDMIDTFAITTELLGRGVREHGVISLEQAVHQLTLKPAAFLGLRERGALREGWHADVVVFDPATVGAGETYTRTDLPAGGARVYAEAMGIGHVIVNGTEIIRDGEYTGAIPGTILRPGRDTATVPIPADAALEAAE